MRHRDDCGFRALRHMGPASRHAMGIAQVGGASECLLWREENALSCLFARHNVSDNSRTLNGVIDGHFNATTVERRVITVR